VIGSRRARLTPVRRTFAAAQSRSRAADHPGMSIVERVVPTERVNTSVGKTGCRIVELPRIVDPRGNLTPIEGGTQVPFEIARVYYLYDVPGGEARGGHAHRAFEEFIVAASGSFDIVVDDGTHCERFFLNRSYYGLYLPPMVWRELDNFSSGSVCLVLASQRYDEGDYIRDYDEFTGNHR
jgi:hypothetical protein